MSLQTSFEKEEELKRIMENLLDSSNELIRQGVAKGAKEAYIQMEGVLEAEKQKALKFEQLYSTEYDKNRCLNQRLKVRTKITVASCTLSCLAGFAAGLTCFTVM